MAVIWSMRRWWRPPSNVGGEPHAHDLVGEALPHDPRAHGQHVRVVVEARVLGGVEAVAQRGAHPAHLVGRELLALAAAAEDDAPVDAAGRDLTAHRRAEDRVVARLLGIGAEVDDVVAAVPQDRDEMLLHAETRVVGADGDAQVVLPASATGPVYVRGRGRSAPQPDPRVTPWLLQQAETMCPRRLAAHPRRAPAPTTPSTGAACGSRSSPGSGRSTRSGGRRWPGTSTAPSDRAGPALEPEEQAVLGPGRALVHPGVRRPPGDLGGRRRRPPDAPAGDASRRVGRSHGRHRRRARAAPVLALGRPHPVRRPDGAARGAGRVPAPHPVGRRPATARGVGRPRERTGARAVRGPGESGPRHRLVRRAGRGPARADRRPAARAR